ncbi:hypothetical protein CsatA_018110 [Cannabis sativa]
MFSFPYQNFGYFETPQRAPFFTLGNPPPYSIYMPSPHQPEMASKIYTPSMKKSSVDLNLETSSTSVSVTQPANCVERLENVDLQNEEKPSQESKLKWSKEATILLISGWLNTIVGNDQISAKFWDRIAEYFNTNHKGEERRTGKQCKDRWNKINQKVVRFNRCYKRVQQTRYNSWSNEQILENAHQVYKYDNNSNFMLVYCWRLLKDDPKWNTLYQTSSTQSSPMDLASTPNLYDNMSLDDIIISELIDDSDEIYFNKFIAGSSSTRRGKKRSHIDKGSCKRT